MHAYTLYVCICNAYTPGTHTGQSDTQKWMSGLLELELPMVVRQHMGAVNRIQVLCKCSQCS